MLASAAVGTVEYRSMTEPIRKTNPYIDNFVEGRAIGIDVVNKKLNVQLSALATVTGAFNANAARDRLEPEPVQSYIKYSDDESSTVSRDESQGVGDVIALSYDYLVCAVGTASRSSIVPGAKENCFNLKTSQDSKRLRTAIGEALEFASRPDVQEFYYANAGEQQQQMIRQERQRRVRIAIVGGGKQTLRPATPMPTPGLPPRSTPASKPSTKKNPSKMPSTPASKRSTKSTPKRTPARLASPMAAASPSLTPSQRLKTARLLEESAERRMQEMTAIRESREQNASAKKLQHEKVLLQNQAVLGQNKEVLGQNKQVIGQNRRILDSNQEDNRELGQALDQENEASEMLYELRNERILQEVAEEDEEEEEEEEDDQPMLPSTRPVHRKLDFNEVVNESTNKSSTDSSVELEDNESQVDNEKDNASEEETASEEAIVDTKSDAKLEEVVPPSPGLLRRGIQGGIQGASDLLTYMSPFGKAAPAKTKTILHYEPLVEEAEEASANADSDSDSDNEDDDDNAEGPTEAEGTTERDTLKAESEDDNHSEDAAVDTLKAESEEEVESEDDNDLDADLEDAELEDEAAAAVDTLKAESEEEAESEKAALEDQVAATKKTKMTAAEKAAARKRAYDSVIGNGKAAAKDDQSNKKKAKKDDKPPKKNDKRPKCKGFFANGNPCTRYVMEGSEYCGLHAAK